jgi:hypothetical protein
VSRSVRSPPLPDDLDRHPLPATSRPRCLASQGPLPGARIKPAVGHRDRDLAAHHTHRGALRSASGARPHGVPALRSGQASPGWLCNRPLGRHGLVGAWGAWRSNHTSQSWSRPRSSSSTDTAAVMCMADTRFSAVLVGHRTRTTGARGSCGHRPRPEQTQLNPTSTAGHGPCCGAARRSCTGKASSQQEAMDGSS